MSLVGEIGLNLAHTIKYEVTITLLGSCYWNLKITILKAGQEI